MTKSPSKNLEDLYAVAFEKITESGPGAYTKAMQVFSWLPCLQEPLSPTAFMTVLTMADPDNSKEPPPTLSEVLDVCFNLVTLDSELNVLRFAHFSVQEFLEAGVAFSPTGNHRLVAMGCLNICAQCAPSDIGASLNVQETPYQYAVLYFAEHTRLANLVDSSDGLFQALKEYVFCDGEPSLAFINWVDEVRELSKSLRRDHPPEGRNERCSKSALQSFIYCLQVLHPQPH